MIVQFITHDTARIKPAGDRFNAGVSKPQPSITQDGMQLSLHGEREYSLHCTRLEFNSSDSPAPMWEFVEPDAPDNTRLQFTRDSESGRLAIAVIDSATQEVLREIPPQSVLGVLSKLSQSREHVFQLLS